MDASPYNRKKRELQKAKERVLRTQISEPEEILTKSVLVPPRSESIVLSITQPELLSEIEFIDATTTTTTTSTSAGHSHSIDDDTTLAEVGDEFSDSPEYSRDSNLLLVPSDMDAGPDSECDLSTGTVICLNSPTSTGKSDSLSPIASTGNVALHDDTDNSLDEEDSPEQEPESETIDFDDCRQLLQKQKSDKPRALRRPSMEAASASSVFILGLDSLQKQHDPKLSVKPLNHSNSLFDCTLSRETSPKPDAAGNQSQTPTSPGMHPLYQHHPHHRHHHQHSPRRSSTSGSTLPSLESNGGTMLNTTSGQ